MEGGKSADVLRKRGRLETVGIGKTAADLYDY